MHVNVMVPSIHLNGTSREDLVKQLLDANLALIKAIEAVRHAAPHGRDYYPQGPEAITKAMAEHKSRLRRLGEVRTELNQIAEAIA